MSAYGLYLSIIHDDNPVGILDRGYPLGNYKLCGIRYLLHEGPFYEGICPCVHSTCGIIKYYDLWSFKKGSCYGQPLLLASGDIASPLLDMCIVIVREVSYELIGLGKVCHPFYLFIACIFISPSEVLPDGSREKHIL